MIIDLSCLYTIGIHIINTSSKCANPGKGIKKEKSRHNAEFLIDVLTMLDEVLKKINIFLLSVTLLSSGILAFTLGLDIDQENAQSANGYSNIGIEDHNIGISFRVGDEFIQKYEDEQWKNITIKGVNIGMAKPGYFPGDASITYEEYLRWFFQIGEMNANTVRIYTVHPPDFYRALMYYNAISEDPIFLLQGVWINEENLAKSEDAFNSDIVDDFKRYIANTIDIIHGNAIIPFNSDLPSGSYQFDISEYVIGIILGVEWSPEIVQKTNSVNFQLDRFDGKYIISENCSAFEVWLSGMMDYCVDIETKRYSFHTPISFINTQALDILDHPSEPSFRNDLVHIDPNNISYSSSYKSGFFSTYHIYSYYPDFMNLEKRYVNYIDENGEKNPYAGYLNHLRSVHCTPILIGEFGLPSSRGMSHLGLFGMNQGSLTEEEQGMYDALQFRSIMSEGYAGGVLFSWQDEWFKTSWNTYQLGNPDRRPIWSDYETTEQSYGLLSFDPGDEAKMFIDGMNNDWEDRDIEWIYHNLLNNGTEKAISDGSSPSLTGMRICQDERHLYFTLEYNCNEINNDTDWINTMILIDTVQDQGITELPINTNVKSERGIDFIIDLRGPDESYVRVDSNYDVFNYMYSEDTVLTSIRDNISKDVDGSFFPVNRIISHEIINPLTGTSTPFTYYNAGKLRFGVSDPESREYDSLSDFYISGDGSILEIRIPWSILNFKDPSKKEVFSDIRKNGLDNSCYIDGIYVGGLIYEVNSDEGSNEKNQDEIIIDSFPGIKNNSLCSDDFQLVTWPEWDAPSYTERLKISYYMIMEVFELY